MRKRFHYLGKIKIRQTWNKYNLYNLYLSKYRRKPGQTFFQQKWAAKAATRAYHGETVRETMWKRLFRRRIRSVVPTNPADLAKQDGSKQAEGRGSGLDHSRDQKPRTLPRTPYLQMTYAPLERRLDTAVFRALFASSTRQARQFVVHGSVKVNGKTMIYPGYQLNPGDMFQVSPERVLFATGAPKDSRERKTGRKIRKALKAERARAAEDSETAQSKSQNRASEQPTEATPPNSTPKQTLKELLKQAKNYLSTPSHALTARRKQDLRTFQAAVKRALSKRDEGATLTLEGQLEEIVTRMAPEPAAEASTSAEGEAPTMSSPELQAEASKLNPEQMQVLRKALKEARENPVDPSKPYSTPWRPRAFMSAFAFIPRYLEVNPNVCAAVYIRHPVARPGLAEVPTPFNDEVNSLAHNWYLRRR